jgi:hypothetical protein
MRLMKEGRAQFLTGKIRHCSRYDTNADRAMLRKLPPSGSGALLIPLVGASGSIAGRQFTPLRSMARLSI